MVVRSSGYFEDVVGIWVCSYVNVWIYKRDREAITYLILLVSQANTSEWASSPFPTHISADVVYNSTQIIETIVFVSISIPPNPNLKPRCPALAQIIQRPSTKHHPLTKKKKKKNKTKTHVVFPKPIIALCLLWSLFLFRLQQFPANLDFTSTMEMDSLPNGNSTIPTTIIPTTTPSTALSSKLTQLTESLKLEHQFLRVPFEHYKKTIRTNHRAVEKEVSSVISVVNDAADSDISNDDAVQHLTSLVSRLQGLKRKVYWLKKNESDPVDVV